MSEITCIYFKNKKCKKIKNFDWEPDDQFYTFWLDEKRQKLYQYLLKIFCM